MYASEPTSWARTGKNVRTTSSVAALERVDRATVRVAAEAEYDQESVPAMRWPLGRLSARESGVHFVATQ